MFHGSLNSLDTDYANDTKCTNTARACSCSSCGSCQSCPISSTERKGLLVNLRPVIRRHEVRKKKPLLWRQRSNPLGVDLVEDAIDLLAIHLVHLGHVDRLPAAAVDAPRDLGRRGRRHLLELAALAVGP